MINFKNLMKKKRVQDNELFGVIGLGRFGSSLLQTLGEAGKEVIALDREPSIINAAAAYTDNAFVVNDLTRETLEKVGIQNCDVVIVCIGEDVSTSILTTLTVIRMGVPKVISKAKSEEHGSVLKVLGAEVVYPEYDMGVRLANRLLSPGIFEYISLSDDVDIMEIQLTEKLHHITVAELDIRKKFGLNIIAIKQNDVITIEIGPQTVLDQNNTITIIGKRENIQRFEEYLQ